jgi:hypothetical protein
MKNKYMVTPQWVLEPLGKFDLDPCTPPIMPWTTAEHRYTEKDDGLAQLWTGRVWFNPPYSNIEPWMQRMVDHRNGVGLTFARTETEWFDQYVWEQADSILFLKGRIYFCDVNGQRSRINSPAPSVLIAYGEENVDCLNSCGIDGKHVLLNRQVLFIAASPSWKNTVSIAVTRAGKDSGMKSIYAIVELIAPDKCLKNKNWRAKVRQKLYSLRK